MKAQVYYCTKTKHTKAIAEAVAKGAGTTAVNIKSGEKPENADILFVGGSLYAGKIDRELREFILSLKSGEVKRAVLFGSAASGDTPFPEMRSLFEGKGIEVGKETFFCPGSFLFLRRGRPNEEDLAAACAFGKKAVE